MLIVGGAISKWVDVISPTTGRVEDFVIDRLPEERWGHTINKGTICGGGDNRGNSTTLSNCIKLQSDGSWSQTHILQEARWSISTYYKNHVLIMNININISL